MCEVLSRLSLPFSLTHNLFSMSSAGICILSAHQINTSVYPRVGVGSDTDADPVDSDNLQPHEAAYVEEADKLHLTEASDAEEVDGFFHQKRIFMITKLISFFFLT